MKNTTTYNCKENDAKIKIVFLDEKIDEIHVQVEGETAWIVIGYKDLLNAINGNQF